MIAQQLRDSSSDEHELEINLVVAARALGFNADHVSGSGEPDGVARYTDYPGGVRKITLESKSSKYEVRSEGDMDFGGINNHKERYSAEGVLLLAPGYTAGEDDSSKISSVAKQQRISCWTVEQLADVIEGAGERHISAKDIYKIVTNCFSPTEVQRGIDLILSPTWSNRSLYKKIIQSLGDLEGSGTDDFRTVDMLKGIIMSDPNFKQIKSSEINKAFQDLAGISKGAIIYSNDSDGKFYLTTNMDELRRRVSWLTNEDVNGRRLSSFRE